ncbi:MAG: metallophosphoesterase, partial [Pseudomonadota bacterium]
MFLNIGARTEARLHLRVLATSDLHAALWPYDYVTDTARPTGGLAMLASAIADHRAGVANCLVLDNGDTYEGTPLADLAAKNALEPHPMVVAMNAIGYDAAVPGNHDFNYGLDALDQIVSRAAFPMVLSNIGRRDGRPLLARSVVLTREMTDIAGHRHTLRIGIVGVAPPLLVDFEGTPVSRVLAAEAMVPAARRELQRLRSDEAIDVAVVLCHGGIDHDAAEDA